MGMKINAQLPLPADLKAEYPLSETIVRIKEKRDREIRDIFTGRSDKFVVIVGPCSADNEDSVCEYVNRLAKVNELRIFWQALLPSGKCTPVPSKKAD